MIPLDDFSRESGGPETPPNLASWYTPGLSDGLGDRLLMFDNTTASPLELLRFRREISEASGFEAALRERLNELERFTHPSFAEIRRVTRLGDDGDLALVSNQVVGKRLAEVMALARGPVLAEQLVRRVTPALAALHEEGPAIAHGLLTPDRIIVTPSGALVVVEHVLGSAVQALHFSPDVLRSTFNVFVPDGRVTIDARTDVAAIGRLALSLLLGRRLTPAEGPDEMASLLDEIGREGGSPRHLQIWLERALQLGGSTFESAREATTAMSDWTSGPELGEEPGLRRKVLLTPAFGRTPKAAGSKPEPHVADHSDPLDRFEREGFGAADPADEADDDFLYESELQTEAAPADAIPDPPAQEMEPEAPVELPPPAAVAEHVEAPRIDPPAPAVPATPDTTSSGAETVVLRKSDLFKQADAAPEVAIRRRLQVAEASSPKGESSTATPMSWKKWVLIGIGALAAIEAAVILSFVAGRPSPSSQTPPQVTATAPSAPLPDPSPAPAAVARAAARRSEPASPATTTKPADNKQAVNKPAASPRQAAPPLAAAPGSTVPPSLAPVGQQSAPSVTASGTPSDPLLASQGRGELVVTTEPRGADVWLDGVRRGLTPLTVILNAGDHTVVVSSGAYVSKEVVPIEAGRSITKRVPMPATTLFVAAQPWANVWIDGQPLGRTPVEDLPILAGPHELLIRHPELGERRQSIEAGPGSPVRLLFNLREAN